MDTPFETGIHSTNSYQYMRAVAEVWSGRWWWAIALPVVTCFALGMALNIAFVFMAFIIAFLSCDHTGSQDGDTEQTPAHIARFRHRRDI